MLIADLRTLEPRLVIEHKLDGEDIIPLPQTLAEVGPYIEQVWQPVNMTGLSLTQRQYHHAEDYYRNLASQLEGAPDRRLLQAVEQAIGFLEEAGDALIEWGITLPAVVDEIPVSISMWQTHPDRESNWSAWMGLVSYLSQTELGEGAVCEH